MRVLFAAGFACALPIAITAAPAPFPLDEIAPGTFVHPGKPLALDSPGHDDIANIGFIVGARCVAVIDTGGSVRIGRALRAAIAQRTALPVCYVINTHVHVDHVLGNVAFKEARPEFIGHAALAAALARSREFFLRYYAADLDAPAAAGQIIGPTRTVASGTDLELDLGGRRIVVHAWPTAHTDCDVSVLDLGSDTLWTGDLLFVRRLPALDGSAKGWLAALDALARLHVTHVVPGHGPFADDLGAALLPERRYLVALIEGTRADVAAGKSMTEAIAHVAGGEKSDWLLWEQTHPRNVARVYREIEWE